MDSKSVAILLLSGLPAFAKKHVVRTIPRNSRISPVLARPKSHATRSWYRRGYLAIPLETLRILELTFIRTAAVEFQHYFRPLEHKFITVGSWRYNVHAVVSDFGLLRGNAVRS